MPLLSTGCCCANQKGLFHLSGNSLCLCVVVSTLSDLAHFVCLLLPCPCACCGTEWRKTEMFGVAVTFWACIREMPGWNFSPISGCLEVFVIFLCLAGRFFDSARCMPRPIPSNSIPVFSPVVLLSTLYTEYPWTVPINYRACSPLIYIHEFWCRHVHIGTTYRVAQIRLILFDSQ